MYLLYNKNKKNKKESRMSFWHNFSFLFEFIEH